MKQLHLKSMIVGLVFGVMSVVIMNNYLQSPIKNAYASDCPSISQIKSAVQEVMNYCTNQGEGLYFSC